MEGGATERHEVHRGTCRLLRRTGRRTRSLRRAASSTQRGRRVLCPVPDPDQASLQTCSSRHRGKAGPPQPLQASTGRGSAQLRRQGLQLPSNLLKYPRHIQPHDGSQTEDRRIPGRLRERVVYLTSTQTKPYSSGWRRSCSPTRSRWRTSWLRRARSCQQTSSKTSRRTGSTRRRTGPSQSTRWTRARRARAIAERER